MAENREKRTFKVFKYRGIEMNDLAAMPHEELAKVMDSRSRRKFRRGLSIKQKNFLNRLKKVKEQIKQGEKPKPVKTHLRNMVVLPEMVGNIVGVHNGKDYIGFEVKANMIGKFLGEFALSYKRPTHGKAGAKSQRNVTYLPLV